MRECKATRRLIINSAKAELGSISLDRNYTKQYNYYNNESYSFHYLLLLGHKLLATKGDDLVANTPKNYIQKIKTLIFKIPIIYKQKILNKIKFKIFFILIGFINQALANPIDTMDKNITKLNEFHIQQNQNYEKYIKVKINTLIDISQSIFLLKQNNELLLIEQKIGAVNGQ